MNRASVALPLDHPVARVGLADVVLLAVAAVWGSSYGLAKELVSLQPVLVFLAIRFGLTALLLAPALVAALGRDARGLLRVGMPLGAVLCAIFLCETWGVSMTTATNAAVLISLCVIMTPLVDWAVAGRRPSRTLLAAALCSVCGVLLINGGARLLPNAGDALILGAALLRALMVSATARLTRHYTDTTLALTAMQALVVALVCAALVLGLDGAELGLHTTTPRFWLIMAWLVLACTIFAFFAQNYAARRTDPSRVSLLMGSEPVFGVLFAVLWLGESQSTPGWVGAALIVGSCLWVLSRPARRPSSR